MTAAYHHTGVFSNKESYNRIRSLLVFSSEFLHFRRTEFSTDAAVTQIEFQLPHLKNFKLKQRSASFGIQRNFKLNKDSQTEFFSQPKGCGEWLSLIQKNLRPVQIFVSSVPSEKS